MSSCSESKQAAIDRRTMDLSKAVAQKPIKTGLRNKITAAIVIIVISMSLASFFLMRYEMRVVDRINGQQQAMVLAKNLVQYIEQEKLLSNPEKLKNLLSSQLVNNRMVWLEIKDAAQRVLVAEYRPEAGKSPERIDETAQGRTKFPRQKGFGLDKQTVQINLPITSFNEQGEQQSPMRLSMGYRIVQPKTHEANGKIQEAMVFFFFLAFGMGIAWVLAYAIIDPVQRLARAMTLVANEEDEFDANGMPKGRRFRRVNDLDINIHTHDEIEQLADEFCGMLRKLENSYNQLENLVKEKNQIALEKSLLAENLEELNRRNEMIIRERTSEIVEKNLRLFEITEELQFQKEELIGMNARLEKISQMKSDFLANMSHELRTPLNSIIGFTEVLKEKMFGEINEKQEKYLANIHASSKHLLQLINNVLDISKVEAGKMELVVEAYSLNRVVDEVQNIIRTLAYKKNIEIKLQLGPDVVVYGDVSKVKQILYNLLSNAIKFTEEKGKVTVLTQEIEPGSHFDGGPGADEFNVSEQAIQIIVRDNGIGIKPEDQERVFLEFEQVGRKPRTKAEGTGLGLALTRRLVHLHGGKVWLKSEAEKGTDLYVVLPVKAVSRGTDEDEGKKQNNG